MAPLGDYFFTSVGFVCVSPDGNSGIFSFGYQ